MSSAARQTVALETDLQVRDVEALADEVYRFKDIAASISSGSFKTMGMVVIPCSMKTLAGIAMSFSDNLLLRAADVVLKDHRRLVLVPRETPLHLGHLRLMVRVAEMGAIIMPPMPAFYHRPKTLDDIVNQTVNRVLDLFDIELPRDLFERWVSPEKRKELKGGVETRRIALQTFYEEVLPGLLNRPLSPEVRAAVEARQERLMVMLSSFNPGQLDVMEQLQTEIEELVNNEHRDF
jgi:4-hydroxy-3-polyprenylbenzoate decarboxylase